MHSETLKALYIASYYNIMYNVMCVSLGGGQSLYACLTLTVLATELDVFTALC